MSSGLRGDGVTDDTAALQSLLTQLPSGSTIYFPPGHYRIDGPISINKPVTLFGESGTVFDCQKMIGNALILNSRGSRTSTMNGVTITGIVFEGPGIETDSVMIDAFYLQNLKVSYVKFHNVGIAAIRMCSSTDVTVEESIFDNVFYTGYGYGVCINDHSDRINVHDNFFVTKGRHGITTGTCNPNLPVADYVQSVTIENNYFEQMTTQAVDAHIQTAGPYVVKGNVINNCDAGIHFRGGAAEITDNVMINTVSGIALWNDEVDPNHLGSKVDQVLDNIMINNYRAIYVANTNAQIQGNVGINPNGGGGSAICLAPYTPDYCNIIGNVMENYVNGLYAETPGPTISLGNNFLGKGGSYQIFTF
jgi:hypothetical protein